MIITIQVKSLWTAKVKEWSSKRLRCHGILQAGRRYYESCSMMMMSKELFLVWRVVLCICKCSDVHTVRPQVGMVAEWHYSAVRRWYLCVRSFLNIPYESWKRCIKKSGSQSYQPHLLTYLILFSVQQLIYSVLPSAHQYNPSYMVFCTAISAGVP
jgi:hypothetical protein